MLGRAREIYKAKGSSEELTLVAADMIKEQALSHIGRGLLIAKFFLWLGIFLCVGLTIAGAYLGYKYSNAYYGIGAVFGTLSVLAIFGLIVVKRRLAALRAAGLEVVQKGVAKVKAEIAERRGGGAVAEPDVAVTASPDTDTP